MGGNGVDASSPLCRDGTWDRVLVALVVLAVVTGNLVGCVGGLLDLVGGLTRCERTLWRRCEHGTGW